MDKIQSKTNRVSANPVKLIAALGNPGEEYAKTYHNAGWLFVNFLKDKLGVTKEKNGKFYKYYKTDPSTSSGQAGNSLILAEPKELFMNDSGQYIHNITKELGIKPEELILAHDDSDIPLGEYKLESGSGSAGHKGVKSVIDALGTKDFMRLRIGVRHNEDKALDFVLSKIKPAEEKILLEIFPKVFSDLEALQSL